MFSCSGPSRQSLNLIEGNRVWTEPFIHLQQAALRDRRWRRQVKVVRASDDAILFRLPPGLGCKYRNSQVSPPLLKDTTFSDICILDISPKLVIYKILSKVSLILRGATHFTFLLSHIRCMSKPSSPTLPPTYLK